MAYETCYKLVSVRNYDLLSHRRQLYSALPFIHYITRYKVHQPTFPVTGKLFVFRDLPQPEQILKITSVNELLCGTHQLYRSRGKNLQQSKIMVDSAANYWFPEFWSRYDEKGGIGLKLPDNNCFLRLLTNPIPNTYFADSVILDKNITKEWLQKFDLC